MMDNVTSLGNIRILKRACCLTITVLAVMLLYTYSSGSAKVHSGTFEGNTRWYYDTRTKTVTIDCKGRMEDGGQHGVSMDWGENERYLKAQKVVFKKGVTYIGKFAFDNFQNIKEIGQDAFYAFSPEKGKLKKVTIRSTRIKKWGKGIFGKARKDLVIRVPKSKQNEYTKALRKGGLPKYVKIEGM